MHTHLHFPRIALGLPGHGQLEYQQRIPQALQQAWQCRTAARRCGALLLFVPVLHTLQGQR